MRILSISFVAVICILFGCHKKNDQQFTRLDAKKTGLNFNNIITENDSFNILDYEYLYNGGGVGIADFDNDGYDDIVFTGNMVSNKLFRNLGQMKFTDVSKASGIEATDYWCSGIAIVDINQDGKKDIYLSTNTYKDARRRKNLLFINQSMVKGEIKFTEMSESYGIADTSYCMNSIFFDYDNDLDLDLLVITNKTQRRNDVSVYTRAKNDRASGNVDILYRNDFDSLKGHPVFTDVSAEAGINDEGFSLGVNICDINQDGYKDIYITNDFISNDLLYINNKNGTFTNRLNDYVTHTCMSAMGNDITDINNDGLVDIIALDMLPEDNFRKKTMMPGNNYTSYINNLSYNYTHQFTRNVLQLNRGLIPELGHIVFSDVALASGIEATDWSWSPLIADFDDDNDKDIIITNGFPKDVTDKDFMDYKASNGAFIDKKTILTKIPEVKLKNYAFKNEGSVQFKNCTNDWGIDVVSYSNGAAYGDLDNDGDLDYVVNNINDQCHLYQNNGRSLSHNHYLAVKLEFIKPNLEAIGAVISYRSAHAQSIIDFHPSRGYLSSMQPLTHIGLGQDTIIELKVTWPNGKESFHKFDKIDTSITIKYNEHSTIKSKMNVSADPIYTINPLISQDTFKDREYIDFNFDPLLYCKQSNKGPAIAVSDVDKNGLQDYYVTGSAGREGILYMQQKNGTFLRKIIVLPQHIEKEQVAAEFLDIDKDGDEDLYIACGSNQFNRADNRLGDILLINQNGQLEDKSAWLPTKNINESCIKKGDFDNDGDMDIFLGGASTPYFYPMHEPSILLRNDSESGKVILTPINNGIFNRLGIINDAQWIDYNEDQQLDLIVTGEWNDIKFIKNNHHQFALDNTINTSAYTGWWNAIEAADIDNDKDIDLILGNVGMNIISKVTNDHPARLYAKDFDGNSSYDFIPTVYFKGRKGNYEEVTYHSKSDVVKEMNGFRKKFENHTNYANAPLDSIIPPKWRKDALILTAKERRSGILVNDGKQQFTFMALPIEAQWSAVNDILLIDIDQDGKKDILLVGNNYGYELTTGRLDASIGCLLHNKGKLNFDPISAQQSGFFFNQDARNLVVINHQGKQTIIQSANNGRIKGYSVNAQSTKYNQ